MARVPKAKLHTPRTLHTDTTRQTKLAFRSPPSESAVGENFVVQGDVPPRSQHDTAQPPLSLRFDTPVGLEDPALDAPVIAPNRSLGERAVAPHTPGDPSTIEGSDSD